MNWLVTTHRVPPHPPQHVQDQYFEFLRYLGVDPEPVEWKLGPWEGEWDLRRVAYLLDRADVVVSPDTGPLHIAVGLGTPSVALMGYTNPKRVGPYRFRDLLVDAFGDPGEEYGPEAERREGRMERITVDQVME